MKKLLTATFFSGAVVFALACLIPNTSIAASSYNGNYWRTQMQQTSEGATTDPSAEQSQMHNWGSSAVQSNVSSLSQIPVQNLTIPVLFGVEVSDLTKNFGDPRPNGRTHEGLDIMAPLGTPIVSPTDAVVVSVGYGASAGNYVYTANPGNERFAFMHMSEMSTLAVGTKLSRGDLIGYVGNTGDASGGATHLHFEVRPNNVPTDPYPRLTLAFSLSERMQFLTAALSKSSNSDLLASNVVANFSNTLLQAQSQNLALPQVITTKLAALPFPGTAGANSDLSLGVQGAGVVTLQQFLIQANKGTAAIALSRAGPTGNFGSITQAALMEYQSASGISPNGLYDATTRAYIAAHPNTVTTLPTTPSVPVTSTSPLLFIAVNVPTRDLKIGISGQDVIWLQQYLISMHIGTAAAALSNSGATGYFGSITQAALIEYQTQAGIIPASGYFGPLSRAYLVAHLK
jgi:peptidoglycan hydrolase-like protein with peptidoglycan-binding domain